MTSPSWLRDGLVACGPITGPTSNGVRLPCASRHGLHPIKRGRNACETETARECGEARSGDAPNGGDGRSGTPRGACTMLGRPCASQCDYLVLGSGIAGLTFALEAAKHGSVARASPSATLDDSATTWAQGGIAAVLDPDDRFEAHVADTLDDGRRPLAPRHRRAWWCATRPSAIGELIALGAQFSRESDGHRARSISRARAATARAASCTRATSPAARCSARSSTRCAGQPSIELLEAPHGDRPDRAAPLRRTAPGGRRLRARRRRRGEVHTIVARATVLATGGAGKVYLYTTNPDVATGDGVAMAYRAGATIANMEFFQFHPTCLYHPQAKSFLISEALRGEGGVLRLRGRHAVHGAPPPHEGPRAARRRRARHRLRDEAHAATTACGST